MSVCVCVCVCVMHWNLIIILLWLFLFSQLISEMSDKCDVRFFGQHDRSLVPRSSVQKFTWPTPTPTTKTTHWTAAIEEFHKYEQNINQMLHQIKMGKPPGGREMGRVRP